jgi:hypothetical protein
VREAESACPADVLEWIAWYPGGDLAEAQRGAVEAHAAACRPCRDEIAMLRGLTEPPAQAPDAAQVLRRVWSRIEASRGQAAQRVAGEPNAFAAPPSAAAARRRRRPARALAAAAALALAAAAGAVAGAWLGRGEALLESASSGGALPAAGAPALDVVFADAAPAARIRDALRAVGGEIAAGPSALGRYRVRLPAGSDAAAAARRLRSEGAGVVLLAEPALP